MINLIEGWQTCNGSSNRESRKEREEDSEAGLELHLGDIGGYIRLWRASEE